MSDDILRAAAVLAGLAHERRAAARPVKALFCGSREWADRATIREWIAKLPKGSIVVHGAARGADSIAGEEARALGYEVREYPADWTRHGKAAGPIRNQEMIDAEHPDVIFAFTVALMRGTGGATRPTGTTDCVMRGLNAGIRCTLIPPRRTT